MKTIRPASPAPLDPIPAHRAPHALPDPCGRRTATAGSARSPSWRRVLAGAGLAALVASPLAAFAQDAPQPKLPLVRLQAGMHVIHAEAAISARQREIGLMMRERLGPNEGMLFVFDHKQPWCFWMRNTLVPLSIAFLDDDGRIVNIADMAPRTEHSHCATQPVRFALEMEQGWFARRAIGPGAQLSNPRVFPGQARN